MLGRYRRSSVASRHETCRHSIFGCANPVLACPLATSPYAHWIRQPDSLKIPIRSQCYQRTPTRSYRGSRFAITISPRLWSFWFRYALGHSSTTSKRIRSTGTTTTTCTADRARAGDFTGGFALALTKRVPDTGERRGIDNYCCTSKYSEQCGFFYTYRHWNLFTRKTIVKHGYWIER